MTFADKDSMSLEQRIQRLEDIDEIKKLRNLYHLFINDCRFDDFGQLFTENATVDMGYMHGEVEPWRGREQIAERFAVIPDMLNQIKQFTHNHTVEVNGDDATGWAMLEARYGSGGNSYNVAGKYEETYKRVDSKWLFDTMKVSFYFTVQMGVGWASDTRHQLIRRPGFALPDASTVRPNVPV